MPRSFGLDTAVLIWIVFSASSPDVQQAPVTGRSLAIEDYYRIQTVGSPAISPDAKWISFTISTRIEEDNSTRTETWLVPADASAKPLRLLHYGHVRLRRL